MKDELEIIEALREFVSCVNSTGGVILQSNGCYAPVGDLDWIDLGEAYVLACDALEVEIVVGDKGLEMPTAALAKANGGVQ